MVSILVSKTKDISSNLIIRELKKRKWDNIIKKLLITTLTIATLFTVFGEKYAWCAQTKNTKQIVRYSIKDSRGVRTGSYRETYQGGTVRKVETYDARGVRKSVAKVRR